MQLAHYRRGDDSRTTCLEKEAQAVRRVLQYGGQPCASDLERVRDFLIEVELWKANCMKELTGYAVQNDPMQIWASLQGAVTAVDDLSALLAVMDLIGFGSIRDDSTGLRRAKRATAVMRFLDPEEWGTVDWRTVAILMFYTNNNRDITVTLREAAKHPKRTIAGDLDCIDERMALGTVQEYRNMRCATLPRAVDVELALYGASFSAWP